MRNFNKLAKGKNLKLLLSMYVAGFILQPRPAWSIPSPDLVVNMFGSAAQILALSSVFAGAGFLKSRKDAHKDTGKWRWFFFLSFFLLFCSIAGNILQYTFQADLKTARLRTNLWRSSTEAGKRVGDTSLKTLAFSDQLRNQNGISTETLSAWITNLHPLNIIDVRETEEFEMGHIKGASHYRYPDTRLNYKKIFAKNKDNILVCFSGNRSSELSTYFQKKGIKSFFLIGGYEKYIAEGRPLVDMPENRTAVLRGLPDYPNRKRLLDTPDVMDFMQNKKVRFVDVRYPDEFKTGHLPDAINIPLRKLPTDKVESSLAALPREPIIAPCYDKRSCFYAEVLGLKLSRLGYDYLGRYTVPTEFAMPHKEKEHVMQWQKTQKNRTFINLAIINPLRVSLTWIARKTGHLAAAIILITIILRLLVLPTSLKADRDTLVQRRIKPRIKSIKERWKNTRRLSIEINRLYKQEKLTPGLNFLGASFQMLLFIMFFSVVKKVSAASTQHFLWARLSEPDPFKILPLLVCGLFFIYLFYSSTKHTLKSGFLFAALSGGLFLLISPINCGVNLYLFFSLAFLVLQNRMTNHFLNKSYSTHAKQPSAPKNPNTGVIMLKDANRITGTGNKAARLADMMKAGLPVPDGFVITNNLLKNTDKSGLLKLTENERYQIKQAFLHLKSSKVAVRSSGLSEDGEEQSFAGVFDSLLNIEKNQLIEALNSVAQSFQNSRAKAYSSESLEQGGVIVQAMVEAEYAGVMFTEHPASAGCMLIEMIPGLGEQLVSGMVTPKSYRFGRVSMRPIDGDEPPIDLEPLVDLGIKVKKQFRHPQDIEWAFCKGKFYVLQARDITAPITARNNEQSIIEVERQRVLEIMQQEKKSAEKPLLIQTELSELLPRPTPISLSLMEKLWDIDGTTDIACRKLGIPYDVFDDSQPYMLTVFGKLYINRAEVKRRLTDSPGAITSFKISRTAEDIERNFTLDFLPQFSKELRLRESLDLTKLKTRELKSLFGQWVTEFVSEKYVHAELINIAADIYLKAAERLLAKRGYDPARYLAHGPETITHKAMSMLSEINVGRRPVQDFLDIFGHRAAHDYELSEPRYHECDDTVAKLIKNATGPTFESIVAPVPRGRLLKLAVERAQRFQSLKEDAKHYSMRAMVSLRKILLELDKRWKLDGDIFYLTIDEITRIDGTFPPLYYNRIEERLTSAEIFEPIKLPAELSILQLEKMQFDALGRVLSTVENKGALQGTCVSGDKEIVSSVRIIENNDEFDEFQHGEIIVARFTDPSWVPLFPKAAGLITEVGGWLSHSTIVAREYGLPCIVGAQGVLDHLKNGQRVRIRADGMVDRRINEDRRHQTYAGLIEQEEFERREDARRLFDRRDLERHTDRRQFEERRQEDRRQAVAVV